MIRNIFHESINVLRLYSTQHLYRNILLSRGKQFDMLKECIISNSGCQMSPEIINKIREEVMLSGSVSVVNENNFDSLFVDACIQTSNFHIGKWFFSHLLSKSNDVRLGVLGRYFKLCYTHRESCDADDFEQLTFLYQRICQKYPFFDHITTEQLIEGLSLTPQWKECLKLLESAKCMGETSSRMYIPIVIAAFINGERNLALQILSEACRIGFKISHDVFSHWLETSNDIEASLEDLFSFCKAHGVFLPPETAEIIVNKHRKGKITNIHSGGRCYACSGRIPQIEITNNEFAQLKEAFLTPVLIGDDIFLKSKPTEFKAFNNFLDKSGKVDVVLDGLNVAYSVGIKRPTSVHSATLRTVVEHFNHLGLRVMVLGRKHMKLWPARDISVLADLDCPTFFMDDLSEDDPLVLYAAMYSGKNTNFVSRDLMRGHKFLLKNPDVETTFEKWQQKNQLFFTRIENNGKVFFKQHAKYFIGAQKSNFKDWHCPVDEPLKAGIPQHIHLKQLHWLCCARS